MTGKQANFSPTKNKTEKKTSQSIQTIPLSKHFTTIYLDERANLKKKKKVI